MSSYRTIAEPVRVEIERVKSSRFIGDAGPAGSEAEAKTFLEEVRAALPDASHHCYAWRIDGDETRSSDDGEPSGSAGRPILKRIEGDELHRVIVVVTRYFGGTKLGTGGLVRAYGAAARAALDAAAIVEHEAMTMLRVEHGYDASGAVAGVLAHRGLEPADASYDMSVHLRIAVPTADVEQMMAELREATAGQATVETEPRPTGNAGR